MEATMEKTECTLSTKPQEKHIVNNAAIEKNRRILIIDDNELIHEDFLAILVDDNGNSTDFNEAEEVLFGIAANTIEQEPFEIDFCFQGNEGVEKVRQALEEKRPYAMAFVDIRMPPGWDGVETIQRIWQVDPKMQICICTAYSDYSWHNIIKQFGYTDKLLILKKPFDRIEVCQIACALVEKWNLSQQVESKQKELETLFDNLSEEVCIAGLLQQDFMPSKLPDTEKICWSATFLPANCVSGDIYDVVRIDDHHIGFYVADVVGHGVPAGLLTIFLKQAIVMYETVGNDNHIIAPSEVMKTLNDRMLAQKLTGNRFVTCCYCLLNTDSMELTYARAGHPYPILMRSYEQPKYLESQGPLLGIFEDAEYPQRTVQLRMGDKFLLYSDGIESIISNSDENGNCHFREEFCQIKDTNIVEMMQSLNISIKSMKENSSDNDDITVVGFEVL
ncbi:MAG: SpoIIE family protein phosphatase [Phycisphaerae bacterium]|nr:SpoIIE family protein phosphatase [Phycisphaerae bacterium]